MFELWMKLQFLESLLAIAFLCVIALLIFVAYITKAYSESRKVKFLKAHGFQRYLMNVSSFGNGSSYGWNNNDLDARISEREMKLISYKDLRVWVEKHEGACE